MFVLGATHPENFKGLRALAEDYFFLVPGVGAQGGSLSGVSEHSMNDHCGLLVNSSRGIIYAGGDSEDFAEVAGQKAKELASEMSELLK